MSLEVSEPPLQGVTTVSAIEQKRLQDALTHAQVRASLALSTKGYWNLRHGFNNHLSLAVCGRVASWLEVPFEEVLRWEGLWDRLSPVGQLVVPALLVSGLSQEQLADRAGVNSTTISDMLWTTLERRGQTRSGRAPTDAVIGRLCDVLGVDSVDLRRAARAIRQGRPHRSSAAVARIRRREGNKGLVRRGEQLGQRLTTLSSEQRAEFARRGAAAAREHWAIATDVDRERWAILHLQPRPSGKFGLCRGCGKLTHRPGRSGKASEHHATCLALWRSAGQEFGEWSAQLQARRRAGVVEGGAPPVQPYPDHRRLTSGELAEHYAAAVLYVQVKLDSPRKVGGPVRQSIGELAEAVYTGSTTTGRRKRATELLRQRVARLADLLPEPSVAGDSTFGTRVRLLQRGLELAGGSGELTTIQGG